MSKIIKRFRLEKFRKILVIYAHSDDESYLSGGLLQKISESSDLKMRLVTIFKNTSDEKSGLQSNYEFENAVKYLNLKNYQAYSLSQLEIKNKELKISKIVNSEIKKFKPDAILTYDPSGVTGNPDHMLVFKSVYNYIQKNKKIKLICRLTSNKEKNYFKVKYLVTYPLKDFIRYDLSFKEMINKIKAIFSYKKKNSSIITKLHTLDWFLDETFENYLLVDKITKLKYKILYG